MPVLQPNEYNISYFDGDKTSLKHNAGFSEYKRWKRFDGIDSLGEFWKDIANKFRNDHALVNKKVLELGCAKGFIVKDLRDMGVDAYGMDISQYALDNAEKESRPYLYLGDVRTDLSQFSNKEFDFVFSIRLWECVADEDIEDLISEITRISKKQAHTISISAREDYYNVKTLQQWLVYKWPKNTILAEYNNLNNYLTK